MKLPIKKSFGVLSLVATGFLASGIASADLVPSEPVVIFGDVALGQSATTTVVVTNVGSRPVQNVTVSLSGNSGEFDLGTCPTYIFPGNACYLSVTLTPQHYGAKRKKLNIDGVEQYSDGSFSDVSLSVELIGTSDNPNKN